MATVPDLSGNNSIVDPHISSGSGGGGGDASAANQLAGNASLSSIDGKVATESTLQDVLTELQTPATSIPPRTVTLNGGDANLQGIAVSMTTATSLQIAAADADESWGLFAGELSFSGATTITFEGGSSDLVLDVPGAGIYSINFREHPYCVTNINQAFTLTSSQAVNIKGKVYIAKGV